MQYKIGDKVKVKDLIFLEQAYIDSHKYPNPYLDSVVVDMYQYASKMFIISYIYDHEDGQVICLKGADWNWDSRWVELPVTKLGNVISDEL